MTDRLPSELELADIEAWAKAPLGPGFAPEQERFAMLVAEVRRAHARITELEATVVRVRRLHDRLAEETDLASPDDPITRGAAAKRIAAALDGWNPAGLPGCDVEFVGGARCAKPAGHRPPGSDDPHVPGPDAPSAPSSGPVGVSPASEATGDGRGAETASQGRTGSPAVGGQP